MGIPQPPKLMVHPGSEIKHIPERSDSVDMSQYSAKKLTKVLYQMMQRRLEALRLYEPLEYLARFHKDVVPEKTCRGGNRSGKEQPIDEPVLTPNGWTMIGNLSPGDMVIGGCGKPCAVEDVFPQGVKAVFELVFNDGTRARCGEGHLWKVQTRTQRFPRCTCTDEWSVLSLKEIRDRWGDEPSKQNAVALPMCVPWMPERTPSQVDPYIVGALLGDGHFSACGLSFSTGDEDMVQEFRRLLPGYEISRRGSQKYDYNITQKSSKKKVHPLKTALNHFGLTGLKSHEKFIPYEYLYTRLEDRKAILQGLFDTDGSVAEASASVEFSTTSPVLADQVAFLIRSSGGSCSLKFRQTYYKNGKRKKMGRASYRIHARLPFCPFRIRRKAQRWKLPQRSFTKVLKSVHYIGDEDCICIKVSSPDGTYVTRDLVVTHNTTICAVEVARAVTGQDPFEKYPKTEGRAYLVAKDGKQVAEVMYRKLFRAGAFKMIQDPASKLWRAWRPWHSDDVKLIARVKPAPPLIPHRFIKEQAWENRAQQVPNIIRLKNGWEISFYPSGAKPPRGVDIDLCWFDEEILDMEWYTEMTARLIDRNGRFLWSATPQTGSEQLYDLSLKSADQEDMATPTVREYFCDLAANPHLTDAQKDLFADKLMSDEERRVRIGGEFAVLSFKVYPEFSQIVHGIDQFEIPRNWTRYMIVDPGRQVCGVLFAAVPPSNHEFNGHTILYDELYIKSCSAQKFGEAVAHKCRDQFFWDFIIDSHGSRVADAGSGRTVEDQYCEALRNHGISCHLRGNGFFWGNDDLEGGLEAARTWLLVGDSGQPRLKVFRGRMEHFSWEAERYKFVRQKGLLTDKPEKRNDHLMDCFRYLALYDPQWHSRPTNSYRSGGALEAYRAKQARQKEKMGSIDIVTLG